MQLLSSLFASIIFTAFCLKGSLVYSQRINWITWEEAVRLSENDLQPKKVFVSVYTDWCGWCKRMDKNTFQNPEVAAYMQDYFYMVRLNAEGRAPINFRGKTYRFVASGRSGYHELALALLRNKMSYPTVVFLDENLKILSPVPGYQKVAPFLKIARYFGDDIYKEKDWRSYAE